MDNADTQTAGGFRIIDRHGAMPGDLDVPGSGLLDPGEDLDQCALARTVQPSKSMNLPRVQAQVEAVQRADARVRLRKAPDAKQRLRGSDVRRWRDNRQVSKGGETECRSQWLKPPLLLRGDQCCAMPGKKPEIRFAMALPHPNCTRPGMANCGYTYGRQVASLLVPERLLDWRLFAGEPDSASHGGGDTAMPAALRRNGWGLVPVLVALRDRSWLQACCSGFLRDG